MKKKYPKVKLVCDKEIDKQYTFNFTKNPTDFRNGFLERFYGKYLGFLCNKKFSTKERLKFINGWIDNRYKLEGKEIREQYIAIQKDWNKKRKTVLQAC